MQVEQFCKSILQIEVGNSKALANLVMGLCSSPQAGSVAEVSLSDCYHYQYSSINKAISSLYKNQAAEPAAHYSADRLAVEQKLLSLKQAHFEKPFDKFWLLNTDITPIFCPHSPTLPQRRYVYKPNNQIKGNRPVEIGYELSTVGLSCRRPLYGLSEPSWNPPLSMRLVPYAANKNSFTAQQVNDLFDNKDLPFHQKLTVNTLDSNYSSPEYIAATYHQLNLANIIRLASNRKVWEQLSEPQVAANRKANKDNRGANKVYGEEFKLNESENWATTWTKQQQFCTKLSNGKKIIVEVNIWENRLLRTKRGHNMKDKPFDLISIELLDAETALPIFKRKMWLGVWGSRRKELSGEEIYSAYRNRYDIEHFFRFGKQKLLLDKYQTPDEEHLQNWMEVVSLAYWLLFIGKQESKHQCRKWQQYDQNHKKRIQHQLKVTPSQVQMQLGSIILSFDQGPFLPKVKIKGKGRQKGARQVKRARFEVLKKQKRNKSG